jgi:S1-C subfamily serine protease
MTSRLPSWLVPLAVLALCPVPVWAAPDDDIEDLYEKAIKAAVKKVAPCVVQIETSGGAEIISTGPRGQPVRKGVGPTSGLIVSADGYVVSSAFNFANKPSSIIIAIQGQPKRYVAKVVATDQTRMITLLKIDDLQGLPVPTAVPPGEVVIGRTAIAVGRTLAGDVELSPSISVGILSAIDRIWGKALQTDSKVSPVNYGGPLIDLYGRVYGVMVPASPQAEGETAGVGWYDSGIGFAIPMNDVQATLARLKLGKDLKPGLLGVTMQSQDQYADVPTVGTVAPGSAAEKVGMKAGDKIIEVEGKVVRNHAQLRHQLGKRYEGDTVSVKVQRGAETVEFKPVLAGAASGSGAGFLGILPMRDDSKEGVEVRFVYPKSPAETAGVKVGDRIMKAGGAGGRPPGPGPGPIPIPVPALQAVKDAEALHKIVDGAVPGSDIRLEVVRKDGGKVETLTAKLGEVPDTVPEKLPEEATKFKGKGPYEPKEGERGYELTKKQTAAGDHSYFVYAPKKADPNVTYALIVWLHPVNKGKEKEIEALADAWDAFCVKNHAIVVCPVAEAAPGWVPGDKDFVLEAIKAVEGAYSIDKRRVVAHGMGVGGQMAFYLGFQARADIRAVATTGAALTNNPKERVANQPLTFFLVAGGKDPLKDSIKASHEKLVEFKYPAIYREIENFGHQYLTDKMLDEMQRWIDSLDRM